MAAKGRAYAQYSLSQQAAFNSSLSQQAAFKLTHELVLQHTAHCSQPATVVGYGRQEDGRASSSLITKLRDQKKPFRYVIQDLPTNDWAATASELRPLGNGSANDTL